MSRTRMAVAAATILCALMLPGVATAQEGPARLTQVVPLSGTSTKGNKQLTGTYTIERFISKGGKIYSDGTFKGKVGNKKVTKENVRLPATVANASGTAKASRSRRCRSRCRRSRPATPARSSRSTSARSISTCSASSSAPIRSSCASTPSRARATGSATGCAASTAACTGRARSLTPPAVGLRRS